MINRNSTCSRLIEYTDDRFIPTNFDKLSYFSEVCEEIKRLDKLPIKKVEIQFSDDMWDLSPLISNEDQKSLVKVFNFEETPNLMKDYLKFYVYWNVTQNRRKKLQTVGDDIQALKLFFRYLDDNYIKSVEIVDSLTIRRFLEYLWSKNLAITTIKYYYSKVFMFYKFYDENLSTKDISSLLKFLNKANKKLSSMIALSKQEGKTDNIPDVFFNNFLSTCIKIMDSEKVPATTRAYAASFVILSQTGLRASQICTLKANAISEVSILDKTKTAYFLEFTELKKQGGNNAYSSSKTILNSLGYKAYRLIETLFDDRRKKIKTDYLLCPPKQNSLPIKATYLSKRLIWFCLIHCDEIGARNVSDKYSELPSITFAEFAKNESISKRVLERNNPNDIVSYPTSHQFRVHLCTELYHRNIPLQVIQHYMNHLSGDMTDYYIRREEYSEKQDEYANAVLEVILKEDTKPLGAGSDALMVKIKEFIEKGNFNVNKDIDTIIAQLKKKMPIKEKLGGICIKSGPKRDCSKDADSDKFYCAYGICPNHFHLYIMADITYTRCKAIEKTMEHNKTNGFIRQSQKERNKLIHVAKNSLLPELEQLKDEMNRKGAKWIKEHHENLTHIIDNLDIITKEVELWMK